MRRRNEHGWDVFPGEGVGCIRDKETCLLAVSIREKDSNNHRRGRELTLPTAPSPVTTHCTKAPVSDGTGQPSRRDPWES